MKQKRIGIIKSTGSNHSSVYYALARLGCTPIISNDRAELDAADALIIPGVGSAGYAMNQLASLDLISFIRAQVKPVLGICLGEQLLCLGSEEEESECLGIIPLQVKKLIGPRILPHMGWNNLTVLSESEPLLNGISDKDNFYFIHSFAAEICAPYTMGICDYFDRFSAVIRRDNFYGVQFHPEKSGASGLRLLKNFIEIKQ